MFDSYAVVTTSPQSMSLKGRALYEGSFLVNGLAEARRFRPDAVVAVSPALADLAIGAAVARNVESRSES